MAELSELMDHLNELSDDATVALFEIIAGLDPLDTDEGKPKYTADQMTVIGDMQSKYRLAGFTD